MHFRLTLLTTLPLFLLFGCSNPPSLLDKIISQGEIRIVTRNSPTTWYEDAYGFAGMEYELTTKFAHSLGVKPVYLFSDSRQQMLQWVTHKKVDMAAAGITITQAKKSLVRFSPSYQTIQKKLVYRKGSLRPKTLLDTQSGSLTVEIGSSENEALLHQLKDNTPPFWHTTNQPPEELLQKIQNKTLDYTVANSHEVSLNRRYLPDIAVAFNIGKPEGLGWAFRYADDSSLYDAAVKFLQETKNNGELDALLDKYYAHMGRLNYVDSYRLKRRIESRLTHLQETFLQAAKKYDVDWLLLAAIAYQESHWDPNATSPTGVRGLMMLTQATAKHIGIENRLDAKQSIFGGAKYLTQVKKKIPSRIPEPDRTWMTLAAYNIGFGHLEDARILTQRQGGNPDSWRDVNQRLPLLTKKKHYSTLKHGYARGGEAVVYVANIRNYFDMLRHEFSEPSKEEETLPLSLTEWLNSLLTQ